MSLSLNVVKEKEKEEDIEKKGSNYYNLNNNN
jgi:hypothetical protein